MGRLVQLVLFNLDEQSYALYLSAVKRVVSMAEITPLPKVPEIVLGIINIQGEVIPAVNIRKRFRLPEREVDLSDQLIIAKTQRRNIAIIADSVSGVIIRQEEDLISREKILPGMEYVEGVLKLDDGIVLIHNLDSFFSLEEEKALDNSLGS